jgi:hypothetical protein
MARHIDCISARGMIMGIHDLHCIKVSGYDACVYGMNAMTAFMRMDG